MVHARPQDLSPGSDQQQLLQALRPKDNEPAQAQPPASDLILDSIGVGVYGLNLSGQVTFANPAALEMTGYSLEECQGNTQHGLVHHSYPDGMPYPIEQCPIFLSLRDGQIHYRDDEVFWRKDGSSFPVSYTSTPLLQDGEPIGAVVVFRDITARVHQAAWEHVKASVFSSVLEQQPVAEALGQLAEAFTRFRGGHAIAIHIAQGPRLLLTAWSGLDPCSRDAMRVLEFPTARTDEQPSAQGVGVPTAHPLPLPEPILCLHPDGSHGPSAERMTVPLLNATGEVLGIVSAFLRAGTQRHGETRDSLAEAAEYARVAIEHSALQRRLAHQAQHDALTGLPNRTLLEDRLEQAIRASRRQGKHLGVCYIDLDRFKQINDTFGHAVGDQYLIRMCAALRAGCRDVDTLARQGGDEFILLLPELNGPQDAETIVDRLLHIVRKPVELGGSTFHPTASIGISIFPRDGSTASALLANADAALYVAKRGGRNQAQVYRPASPSNTGGEDRWMEAALGQALEREQFRLLFQPVVSSSGHLHGFEALLRWHSPQGILAPQQFLPVAEQTGQIVPIGAWVLRQACQEAAGWGSAEGTLPLSLSVNVSGPEIEGPDFFATVCSALDASGLPADRLHLDVPEAWILADPARATSKLDGLRRKGVSVAIDGFGTGQSSFGSLHDLPVDYVKLDASLVARLNGSARQRSTLRAIVVLAHHLDLRVIAEGVETAEQREELNAIDCDLLQGFLLAPPMPADGARQLLALPQPGWAALGPGQ